MKPGLLRKGACTGGGGGGKKACWQTTGLNTSWLANGIVWCFSSRSLRQSRTYNSHGAFWAFRWLFFFFFFFFFMVLQLQPIYRMSDEPARKEFLDRLVKFSEDNGKAARHCSTLSRVVVWCWLCKSVQLLPLWCSLFFFDGWSLRWLHRPFAYLHVRAYVAADPLHIYTLELMERLTLCIFTR